MQAFIHGVFITYAHSLASTLEAWPHNFLSALASTSASHFRSLVNIRGCRPMVLLNNAVRTDYVACPSALSIALNLI